MCVFLCIPSHRVDSDVGSLVFDSGEQNAEPLLPYYLQEYHGLSATMRLAKRYNGVAILWEHRFYGTSLPFPVNVRRPNL